MALKIAIVGRPNVGKSTLFNRLAGRRLALVDDRPGVTRDRKFGSGRLGDLDLDLIDTAGFEDVTDESLEARMRAQTERAIEEATVALFVIDSREGVTPADEIFAEILRKSGKPVILAANKAEGKQGDAGVLDAFRLGLGEPIAISAEHGEGMSDLYYALLPFETPEVEPDVEEDEEVEETYAEQMARLEAEEDEEEVDSKPIQIAIVGRPNAGKSTLVNRLIGEERLLTGPEAGITRDAIPVDWEWNGRSIRLVDTAGLRRKAKVQEKLEKMSTHDSIRAITFAEVVILVMDATHPFETQDLQIADLVEREGRALVFVLAKWDLIEDAQARLAELIDEAQRQLPQVKGSPIIALSAETGRGLDRLMPAVIKSHDDWATKVKTKDLNNWLAMAVQRHPPPAVNGRRVKPKYMAQTKGRPPTFVLFATRAEQLPDHYQRYLVNSLRESFDLPGVPIRLTVKSSRNPYAAGEEKSGGGPAKTAPRARTGLKAKTRIAAAASAKAGAEGKPKVYKSKAKPVKAGAPRGRAAKLLRPGVKPKRASRPSSTRRTPR